MENKQENKLNKGDSAPSTAPETEENQTNNESDVNMKAVDIEKTEEAPENTKDTEKSNKSKEEAKKKKSEDSESFNKKRNRFDNVIRKKLKWFLELGMPRQEAFEKAVVMAVAKGIKPEDLPGARSIRPKRNEAEGEGIKICIVLDKYPEEQLSPEQLKTIQEAVTDKILEMGKDSTLKPKFNNCIHREGFLMAICADKETADWLKEIIPALQPFEDLLLKAVDDDDMPHLENYVGFFPNSVDYPNEKILKLLETQNDSFNVSKWIIVKKENVRSEAEVTFTIDRKYSAELKKADCKVNYKFGLVQLWPKDKKNKTDDPKDVPTKPGGSDNKNSRLRKPKPRKNDRPKGPPRRSNNWKNESPSPQWRRRRDELERNREPRDDREFNRRIGGRYNIQPWSNGSSGGSHQGQGINSYFTDSWGTWN